jgi:hypothetical protein
VSDDLALAEVARRLGKSERWLQNALAEDRLGRSVFEDLHKGDAELRLENLTRQIVDLVRLNGKNPPKSEASAPEAAPVPERKTASGRS